MTVAEMAESLGLPVDMIRRRIDAGDLPVRWVEVNGRLEVRVPAPGADGRPVPPSDGDGAPPGGRDGGESGRQGAAPNGGAAAEEVTLNGSVQRGRPGLTLPGVPTALAGLDTTELVAGLFDRWERSLERRIEAEQRLRFEAELERRMRQIRELHGELDGTRQAHASELAEREREAMALRVQLRELEVQAARRRRWWRRG